MDSSPPQNRRDQNRIAALKNKWNRLHGTRPLCRSESFTLYYSGRQLNLRILHCLEHEWPLVAKFETAATMQDDVATGRRTCEPYDSVPHGNLSIMIPLPEMHQFITDKSDRRSFHIG